MSAKSASIEPVVKKITVECALEEAFHYFTADFSMWWPAATHSVVAYASEFKDKPAAVTFEPRVGGRIFERTRAGEEHLWGTVLEWKPPMRVVFSFHPGRDEKEAQTVEVTFSRTAAGTRVVLAHSGWEKLGANAQQTRDRYNQGWEGVFVTAYHQYTENRKPSPPPR
jgi:uncharacterized protein YndB with AHSA1/START domain